MKKFTILLKIYKDVKGHVQGLDRRVRGVLKMSEEKKVNNETELYLSMMREKPVYRKMVQEGVFTDEQLDECILTLYKNDLKEENK